MANRYFNKQTTNARQALADGGPAEDPRGTGKSQRPNPPRPRQPSKRPRQPSLGDEAGPRRKLAPRGGPRKKVVEIQEIFGPKDVPRKKLGPKDGTKEKINPFVKTDKTPKPKNFDNTDKTDREKIIRDRIMRNKIKDRLDKLKEKMKRGLDPKSPKLKQLQEQMKKFKSSQIGGQMAKKQRQADYMKKHGKNPPRRKTLSVTNSYKKEVEGLK